MSAISSPCADVLQQSAICPLANSLENGKEARNGAVLGNRFGFTRPQWKPSRRPTNKVVISLLPTSISCRSVNSGRSCRTFLRQSSPASATAALRTFQGLIAFFLAALLGTYFFNLQQPLAICSHTLAFLPCSLSKLHQTLYTLPACLSERSRLAMPLAKAASARTLRIQSLHKTLEMC